jgi:DNA replicative helicase MCM subunit Mcm2 (Cdc46/Mcm family)
MTRLCRWLRTWWSPPTTVRRVERAEEITEEIARKRRADVARIREARRALDSFTQSVEDAMRGQS